jgi:hypothetical protein
MIAQRRDESIATFCNGLNVAGLISRIAQCLPQPGDRAVQTVIEINKRIRGPELLVQILPGHQFALPHK